MRASLSFVICDGNNRKNIFIFIDLLVIQKLYLKLDKLGCAQEQLK